MISQVRGSFTGHPRQHVHMHMSWWSAFKAPHSHTTPILPPTWQFHMWLPVQFTNMYVWVRVCFFRRSLQRLHSELHQRRLKCCTLLWPVVWTSMTAFLSPWQQNKSHDALCRITWSNVCYTHLPPIKYLTNVPLGHCRGCFRAETLCALASY